MMKKFRIVFPFFILAVTGLMPLLAWEKFDRVLAVVNNRPIIESEVNKRLEQHRAIKDIPRAKLAYEKSRIIDNLIENELIFETAEKESIEISDRRVINQLNDAMTMFFKKTEDDNKKVAETVVRVSKNLEKLMGDRFNPDIKIDSDLKKFMAFVEKKEKTDFFSFFDQMKVGIARQQIMSIAIGANPPSSEDARKWYNKNREKLGFEVHVKHILIVPKGNSLADEKEANDKLEGIRQKVLAGESFEKLAAKHSQDTGSAQNGGDIGWQMLGQLDPYFANNVFQMSKKGQISKVFKSGFGYHIVKYIDRRAVTYEKVEELIMWKLHSENMAVQFEKWLDKRKNEASIEIYMEDYVEKK
ncbi:MAG TPA: peptidylprolyl isomerase [Spirochaetota bacterium]|nr:peptidylprolyl isomerase [Spirochaetota bacterium]